jgi:S-(hydroxymethyl)glutathione dehydrogenase/alcohol dehydrogenase
MKAAVMRATERALSLEEVRIDDPGPGEVLVKTAASGICHSDLHVIEGGLPVPPPCILGHEPARHRREGRRRRHGLRTGRSRDRLHHAWCGVCKFCTQGRPYLCPTQYMGRPLDAKLRASPGMTRSPLIQFANLSSFAEKMLCPSARS